MGYFQEFYKMEGDPAQLTEKEDGSTARRRRRRRPASPTSLWRATVDRTSLSTSRRTWSRRAAGTYRVPLGEDGAGLGEEGAGGKAIQREAIQREDEKGNRHGNESKEGIQREDEKGNRHGNESKEMQIINQRLAQYEGS